MKKFLVLLLWLVPVLLHAQGAYTGVYGYTLKAEGNPPIDVKAEGPTGKLVLIQMKKNLYRFWLDINRGWPSYNMGESDGTITIVNDTASFDNTYEDSKDSCWLRFTVGKQMVKITSTAYAFDCGFGHGVVADGEYIRLKEQPAINNQWLKEQYPEAPVATITVKEAEVFEDENCLISKKQFFAKGERLLNVAETVYTFYTEYINEQGKFLYGWLKKSDVNISNPD
jgi:hypothetical protein